MPPAVVVFHSEGSFHPLEVFQHVAGTAELIWAAGPDVARDIAMLRLLPKLGTFVDISGLGPDEVAAALSPLRPTGIVTFMDKHLRLAAAVAQRLGLAYHSPAVADRLVDKRLQRRALADAGVAGPRFWPLADRLGPGDAEALAREVAYPAVLKPAEGSDSRGVSLVTSPDDLVASLAAGGGWLVEELMVETTAKPAWRSADLRVESVASPAGTSHVAVRGVFPVTEPFRLTGTFVPADLEDGQLGEVLATVSAAIEALGVTSAVVDTEIRLTPEGPKVIEVNGRVAGTVPFILAGVSEVDLFQLACEVASGAPVRFEDLAPCRAVAFSWRAHPPVGASRLVALEGVEQLKQAVPEVETVNVRLAPGSEVDWRDGTRSVVAIVQGRAASHEHLAAAITRTQEILRPVYE